MGVSCGKEEQTKTLGKGALKARESDGSSTWTRMNLCSLITSISFSSSPLRSLVSKLSFLKRSEFGSVNRCHKLVKQRYLVKLWRILNLGCPVKGYAPEGTGLLGGTQGDPDDHHPCVQELLPDQPWVRDHFDKAQPRAQSLAHLVHF